MDNTLNEMIDSSKEYLKEQAVKTFNFNFMPVRDRKGDMFKIGVDGIPRSIGAISAKGVGARMWGISIITKGIAHVIKKVRPNFNLKGKVPRRVEIEGQPVGPLGQTFYTEEESTLDRILDKATSDLNKIMKINLAADIEFKNKFKGDQLLDIWEKKFKVKLGPAFRGK